MAQFSGFLVSLARTSDAALRRASVACAGWRGVRVVHARVIGPGLTAVARFMDARAEAFSSKAWM
jgi:hypothetical protein